MTIDSRGKAVTPHTRWRAVRVMRALAITVVALFALYLVVINVFLSTSLFAKVVNAKPETIDIHYRRSWSILPGVIHAKDLSIRGRDDNVEWILRLDDVEFGVKFAALARRRFETTYVRGRGTSFRLRRRLAQPPASAAQVADLPPIDDLPPYSVRPASVPSAGLWSDKAYNLWTAHLEDVISQDTREVWIDRMHFQGSARITGRFLLRPLRAVEVGPIHVSVPHGDVSIGDSSAVERLDGSTADVTLERFDPRVANGAAILGGLSLRCDVAAVVPEVARLPINLPRSVRVAGSGEIHRGVLIVQKGVLARGSHLEATWAPFSASSRKVRATGEAVFQAGVEPDASSGRDRLAFHARAGRLEISQLERTRALALVVAPRLDVTGEGYSLEVARPFEDLHLVAELEESTLPEARALSRYIPKNTSVELVGGSARARARVEVWMGERRAAGSATLRAGALDLRVAKMRVRGHADVRAGFASYDFDTGGLRNASLELAVSHGSLSSERAPSVPLVKVRDLRLRARGRRVDLADPLRTLDVTIAMPNADVVATRLLHAYLPKGSETLLVSGHARFSLAASLVVADRLARGTLDLESKGITFAHRDWRLEGNVRVRARVHGWRWTSGDLALDEASVDVIGPTLRQGRPGQGAAGAAMAIRRIVIAASSPHFAIVDPLARLSMSVSMVDARVHDRAALEAFLPDRTALAVESEEGGFGAELRLDVTAHVARGQLRVSAFGMGAGNDKIHLRGNVQLFAKVADWDFDRSQLFVVNARVTVGRVRGRFRNRGGPQFSADLVAVDLRSSSLNLETPKLALGDLHLVIHRAEVPDARALGALLPPNSAVAIESGFARVQADFDIDASRRSAAGGLDAVLTNGAVRLGDTRLSGDLRLRAGLRNFDPDAHRLGLSDARLTMRNVAVTGASSPTAAWGGDVTLQRASLQLGRDPRLDGLATVDARDARPLLAVLFGKGLPGIVVALTDVPRLIGSAWVTVQPDRVGVVDLCAGGGDIALRGSYAASGHHRRGAVVAQKWILSMGLGMEDDGTHVRFFGLDGWLRDRTRRVLELLDGR